MGIKRKRRIFLGAQEISGMMERLNNAFHDMGIESDFYCIPEYAFDLGKRMCPFSGNSGSIRRRKSMPWEKGQRPGGAFYKCGIY